MRAHALHTNAAGLTPASGVRIPLAGVALALVSDDAPDDLRVAFDDNNVNASVPMRPGMVLAPGAFSRAYAYWSDTGALYDYNGFSTALRFIALDAGEHIKLPPPNAPIAHDVASVLVDTDGQALSFANAGVSVRLLAYRIEATADATIGAAGRVNVGIGAAGYGGMLPEASHTFYLPNAIVSGALGSLDTGRVDLSRGQSAGGRAFTQLQLRLDTALTSGKLRVTTWYRYVASPVAE